MFYRLKPDYKLRGWKGMPWVLVKCPENWTRQITQEMFQLLLLCDGETELDGLLDAAIQETLQQCKREGLIEPCTSPLPLDKDQYYRFYKNRYVQSIFWSITGRCNYRCRHCFMDAPCGKLGELTTGQAFDLIDQMADCGVLRVDITGGEPFVRRDFWRLVDRILSYNMVVGKIYTNGWLLNEKVLDEFERRGIKPDISISFDGVGWHDWMRGVSGAEEAALRALQLCKERGFVTDVEMCVHRGNKDTLPQTIEALRAVGVKNIKLGNVAQTPLWQCNSQGNALTNQEYVEAMLPYITWYYQEGQPIQHLMLSSIIDLNKNQPYKIIAEHYDGTEKCLDCYMCGAARMACYITPEGRLLPCMPMTSSPKQESFSKIQDIGLKQGLSNSYYMQFVNGRIKDLFEANAECASCPYRLKCGGGCRATALLGGSRQLMGCDRTMCLLWKGGYVERIRQTAEKARAAYESRKAEAST